MKPANLFIGFTLGALTGIALGILFAPDSSEKTRRKIVYVVKRNNKAIQGRLQHYQEYLKKLKDKENNKVEELLDNAYLQAEQEGDD